MFIKIVNFCICSHVTFKKRKRKRKQRLGMPRGHVVQRIFPFIRAEILILYPS